MPKCLQVARLTSGLCALRVGVDKVLPSRLLSIIIDRRAMAGGMLVSAARIEKPAPISSSRPALCRQIIKACARKYRKSRLAPWQNVIDSWREANMALCSIINLRPSSATAAANLVALLAAAIKCVCCARFCWRPPSILSAKGNSGKRG